MGKNYHYHYYHRDQSVSPISVQAFAQCHSGSSQTEQFDWFANNILENTKFSKKEIPSNWSRWERSQRSRGQWPRAARGPPGEMAQPGWWSRCFSRSECFPSRCRCLLATLTVGGSSDAPQVCRALSEIIHKITYHPTNEKSNALSNWPVHCTYDSQ